MSRLADAARVLPRLRAGKRVVLAHGCFDLLDAGHLRYLEGARGQGDFLVVAVSDDASVQRRKGPGHPLLPEEDRLRLVRALRAVDLAFLSDGDDVEGVVRSLRPEAHAAREGAETSRTRDLLARIARGGPEALSG